MEERADLMCFSLVVISLHVVEEPEGGEAGGFLNFSGREWVLVTSIWKGEEGPEITLPRRSKYALELLAQIIVLAIKGKAAELATSFLDTLDGA